jgi:hypothetical protein
VASTIRLQSVDRRLAVPSFLKSQEAALKACAALLEAFNPEYSVRERRAQIQQAVDYAAAATGMAADERPDAGLLFDSWELVPDGTEA